ncbi:hypothetical protein GG344DRAFT_83647 [Lentinula edodes]|nr:hypothetical protein GG344DRAFT_83647 [Lentinula edodes]
MPHHSFYTSTPSPNSNIIQLDSSQPADTSNLQNQPPTTPVDFDGPITSRKQKVPGLYGMSDFEAWNYENKQIIDDVMTHWRSSAYEHYNISLKRDQHPSPTMTFVFKCQFNHPDH